MFKFLGSHFNAFVKFEGGELFVRDGRLREEREGGVKGGKILGGGVWRGFMLTEGESRFPLEIRMSRVVRCEECEV